MNRMLVQKLLALFVAVGAWVYGGEAMAVTTADQMTCDQAVAYYKKNKRIYVLSHGKDIVPIYGMKPIQDVTSLRCEGRAKSMRSYWVQTQDDDQCVIAAYCN